MRGGQTPIERGQHTRLLQKWTSSCSPRTRTFCEENCDGRSHRERQTGVKLVTIVQLKGPPPGRRAALSGTKTRGTVGEDLLARTASAARCALLRLDFGGPLAERRGFLHEFLLTRRVLFKIGLHAKQQSLVGESLGIIGFQLDGLVDCLVAG